MIEFIKRWEQLAGRDAIAKMMKTKLKSCLRVNTLKTTAEDLVPRMRRERVELTKIDYLQNGFFADAPFALSTTTEHLLGYYYMQEAASQIPAEVLDPKPGELVLDMAAAPGSKTTQISQMMHNKGVIVALDPNPKRLNALKNNCERLGVGNVVSYKKDARYAFELGKKFDKILLDAPCSGNLLVDEHWLDKHTVYGLRDRVTLQKELLKAAILCAKPGTRIVYSTCSMEPEENEFVIDWFLQKYPQIRLEPIDHIGDPAATKIFDKDLNPEIAKCHRIWPHKTGTQPFFIANMLCTK